MELREVGDTIGIAAVLATLCLGLQLLAWGTAAEPYEPSDVDSYELPNPAEVSLQGAGARASRARALEAERRLAAELDEL